MDGTNSILNLPVLHVKFLIPLLLIVYALWRLIYQHLWHPLHKFPGPFWASQTHLWKVYYMWTLRMPEEMLRVHRIYGPVVRIGPNDLSFQSMDAVGPIYKSGRAMPKTSFYHGFTTLLPNLFGTCDETLHAIRRRQMSHSFSTASLMRFESSFDIHLRRLVRKVNDQNGRVFNLKDYLACYAFDIIGQLAFDKDLGTLDNEPSLEKLPPIPDHIWVACLFGMMPSLLPYSMKLGNRLPIPGLRRLLLSRKALASQTTDYVMEAIKRHKNEPKDTLLSNLLEATDPETGTALTSEEVCSEAFAFLVAGAHTTSATLTFLFYHLMHHPAVAEKVTAEICSIVPKYNAGENQVPYTGLESKLPYTMACIRENFRVAAVFNMPLPRLVTNPHGVTISGHHVPHGTHVSVVNHVLHHDPQKWGDDHDQFIPERWFSGKISPNDIMPFGTGHRACIGRNIANINILKVFTTLWRNFQFEPEARNEVLQMESVGVGEKKGPLFCKARRREE